MLGRPDAPKVETINDADCFVSNFWRAIKHAPDEVAKYADWPVNEADLLARNLWLTQQDEFRARMKSEPDFFDAKIAGWWVWGLCSWIGSGFCETTPKKKLPELGRGKGVNRQRLACTYQIAWDSPRRTREPSQSGNGNGSLCRSIRRRWQ